MNESFLRSISLKGRRMELALFAAAFCLLTLFIVRYMTRERFIYFWDYVDYHNVYIRLGHKLALSPFPALQSVYHSIRENEYNFLPIMFLLPFRFAFGPGRLSFILAITVMFAFPSIVLFSFAAAALRADSAVQSTFERVGLTFLALSGFAFLPLLWIPVLIGSVDVGGVIIVLIVLMLYFRADLADQSMVNLVAIGLLLSLLVLFRRWFAYWVVGFFGALFICEGLRYLWNKERRVHWVFLARNILIMGGISVCSFFLVATPIAWKMLTTNYRDIYSAYRSSHPFIHNLAALYNHIGLLTLGLAGLGIALSLVNEKRRNVAFFLCMQFVISFALFARTQDFVLSSGGHSIGAQHLYLALVTIGLFAVFFMQDLFLRVRSHAGKAALLLIFLAGSLANFCVTFMPRAGEIAKDLNFALPKIRQYPMVRTDLDQMQAMLDTLHDLIRNSPASIYILASSFSLNSSVAQGACFLLEPTQSNLAYRIFPTTDVDKRDGFPVLFLESRYVVLTIPFGYHLAPEDQRVIGILANQLVSGEGIGKSYDRLNYEFRLEDGSYAFIYQRTRPLDPLEVKALSDQFVGLYPGQRKRFELSPELIRKVSAL
jgi:hypothetical protein